MEKIDFYLMLGFGFGIFGFFWGFTRLRRKRLIENIPTSKVRSLAMGLVELVGKAKKKINLLSPFCNVECVFYRYKIERYKKQGKSSSWVTIAKGDSSFAPFYLEDDTGRVLVSPKDAEFDLPHDYLYTTGWGKELPQNLIQFMEYNKISYRGLFGSHRLRFTEWYICPDESVYVLGVAKKCKDFLRAQEQKLVQKLEELKNDSGKMKKIDLNQDGKISMEEWDIARKKIEQEILQETLKSCKNPELADVVVGKGEVEKIFIISDHSEKKLISSLAMEAGMGIFGGAVLALGTLFFLLLRFGLLGS